MTLMEVGTCEFMQKVDHHCHHLHQHDHALLQAWVAWTITRRIKFQNRTKKKFKNQI
jgi:hypothetical protein